MLEADKRYIINDISNTTMQSINKSMIKSPVLRDLLSRLISNFSDLVFAWIILKKNPISMKPIILPIKKPSITKYKEELWRMKIT